MQHLPGGEYLIVGLVAAANKAGPITADPKLEVPAVARMKTLD
jgi:hypothetical protein